MESIDSLEAIQDEEQSSTWMSIGDLMSGLLLLFALLFIATLLQLRIALDEKPDPTRIIVGELIREFKNNNLDLDADPKTGDVTIREAILFDENSSLIKPAGRLFLEEFIKIYSSVIFKIHRWGDKEICFENQVKYVVVEGHASSKGTDQKNLQLSAERALSVSRLIMFEMDFPERSKLILKLLTAGRGEVLANQDEDRAEDRRVIFKIQFQGDDFSIWLKNLLKAND